MKNFSFSIFNIVFVFSILLLIVLIVVPFNLINLEQAERIAKWNEELKRLKERVEIIDNDSEYNYELKNQKLYNMINTMKLDLKEFQRAYDDFDYDLLF